MALNSFPGVGILRRFRRDQAGATAVLFALSATGLFGMLAASVDVGLALVARERLDASTQAGALVGARAMSETNATPSGITAAVTGWTSQHPVSGATLTSTSTALICVTSTANLPNCNGTTPNSIRVTQSATVTTHFLKMFGYPSLTVHSSATAAAGGGTGLPMRLMFVLDSTASMNNTDSGCTVPGISRPTRYQCALYSIQEVLRVLQPSLSSVALMAFPGTATQFNPANPCPTQPTPIPYLSTNIHYQIGTGFDNTYGNGSGTLNNTSPFVRAVGNRATSLVGCQQALGGQGSYMAEVIGKAQAALPAIAGTKNVMVLLSDGDFNASKAQLSNKTSFVSKQCGQAVTAAQAATAAGITVYSVAYGSPLSGCSSGDTYNPCTTMQAMASDKSKFYSTNSNCFLAGSPNNVADLPGIFKQIAVTLSKPRLVLF